VSCPTPSTGLVQVNGARVGFTLGVATTALLPVPIRAYDSRAAGSILGANTTRTITLPTTCAPTGASGVLASVTAVQPTAPGVLKVYAAGAAKPVPDTLHFLAGGNPVTSTVPVGISSARQLTIFASAATHVFIDVLGYLV
jgi:hypothetical protein